MARNKRGPKNGPIDSLIRRLLTTIDPDQETEYNLSDRAGEFKDIINSELELAKGMSDGSIIDFSRSISETKSKNNLNTNVDATDDILKYINKNSQGFMQYYDAENRNKMIEARDNRFISKFVPTVTQAIRIILTHIVSSDDLSGQVKRILEFGASISDSERSVLTAAIEKLEKDENILNTLKNTVYKNTFLDGTYYVYAISYNKLFKNYAKALEEKREMEGGAAPRDARRKSSKKTAVESVIGFSSEETRSINSSFKGAMETVIPGSVGNNVEMSAFGDLATVTCVRSSVPFFFDGEFDNSAEGLELATEAIDHKNKKFMYELALEASNDNTQKKTRHINDELSKVGDGTYDADGKNGEYDVSGTYTKFISCRNIIPVEILNNTIGYFYIAATPVDRSKQPLNIGNMNMSNIKKQTPVETIANALSKKIADNFSDKFVAQNERFKKLIADCIMLNGVTNTSYKVQFIPAEDIIEFKINPDENRKGQSILADAAYPAKSLAAVTMRKTLNYINKSGDKTIMTVRGGNADISRKNQAMRIIRNMQESNIVVSDIIGDSNNIFHKYSADAGILMPTSRSGQRLVEFEKMDGQQIDMNTDWEKEQENQTLLSMGTPPLLIEQHNQADFAKSFTSAHVGFAGIVAGWQGDLEGPTTELYKRFISNLDISDDIKKKVLPVFEFKLPRPLYSSVQTSLDALQSATSLAEQMTVIKYGEPTDDTEKDAINKVKFRLVKELTPCIPWEKYEEIMDQEYMMAKKVKDEVPQDATANTNDFGDDEF